MVTRDPEPEICSTIPAPYLPRFQNTLWVFGPKSIPVRTRSGSESLLPEERANVNSGLSLVLGLSQHLLSWVGRL